MAIGNLRKGENKIYKTRLYSRIKKMSDNELLLKEIEETRLLMKLAYFKISQTVEKELVESAILELRSLELKHAYLIKKLKETEK